MLIGAHVSCSGGLERGIDRAREIGAEAIQIFSAAPQTWRPSNHSDESVARFRENAAESAIDDVFIHAIYLINLGTEAPEQLGRSIGALKLALKTSSRIGARGVIFHVGSHKGVGFTEVLPQVLTAVDDVLSNTPEDSWLILENSAGMGGSIGSDFAELGAIINESGNERLKVCLDTCHTLAAGYEIRTKSGLDETWNASTVRSGSLDLLRCTRTIPRSTLEAALIGTRTSGRALSARKASRPSLVTRPSPTCRCCSRFPASKRMAPISRTSISSVIFGAELGCRSQSDRYFQPEAPSSVLIASVSAPMTS